MAASAPSNFMALNAEAQQKAIETKGESIAKGMQNLLADLQQGHVSMTDESAFEVGRNVATTEGAVVFENELFQLIEYKPLTKQGVRAALPGGAALHQQVLHPRPAAGELADPLPGRTRATAPSS
jgi:poly(3-hydroxyalkanoate) synthetase